MSDRLDEHLERYFLCNPRIQSDQTIKVYRLALSRLAQVVGHPPTLDDLTDDNVAAVMQIMLRAGRAPATVNERRDRLHAFWRWLAKRGIVKQWPTTPSLPEPIRIPKAWSRDELTTLLRACAAQPGWIACVSAAQWWTTLHYVAWDTGERIGALLQAEWSHLEGEWLTLPAEVRKGKKSDRAYKLCGVTLAALEAIRFPKRMLIWPWPWDRLYVWPRYKRLRREAGLPTDSRSAFHRMRRSVGSWVKALGGNASDALGHLDPRTTASYLDPRIAGGQQASDILFRIDPPPEPPRAA
jgi:integrase